jgi:hypothetical protein
VPLITRGALSVIMVSKAVICIPSPSLFGLTFAVENEKNSFSIIENKKYKHAKKKIR